MVRELKGRESGLGYLRIGVQSQCWIFGSRHGAGRQQQPQLSWRPKSYPQLHNSHFVLSKPDLSSKYRVNANVVDVFSSTLQAEPHKSDQTAELADVSHLHNAPLITKSHSKFCTLGSVQTFGNNSWSQSNNCRQQLNLSWPPNLMNGFHI